MYDINYYMSNGKRRSKWPVIYQIETTNECNFNCPTCPRNLMTRSTGCMSLPMFKKIVDQLKPWTMEEWGVWLRWCFDTYDIPICEQSEDSFYLYVISQAITLHGWGEPIFDPTLTEKVEYLTEKGFPSYVSIRPENLSVARGIRLAEAGLGWLKLPVWPTFPRAKVEELVAAVKGSDMEVVLCQLNTGDVIDVGDLKDKTYYYIKDTDQQWYHKGRSSQQIMWNEPCKFPYYAMAIQWDGAIVTCNSLYDSQNLLGRIDLNSLNSVWLKAGEFKRTPKCLQECDYYKKKDFNTS